MGQNIQEIKAIGSMVTDIAEEFMKEQDSCYNLNLERSINNQAGSKMGGNAGLNTPAPGNRLVNVELPAGINTVVGSYESPKTNEAYVLFHNTNTFHGIFRINGNTNTIQILVIDPKLGFVNDPKHYFKNRIHLFFNHNSFIETQNKIFRKYLTWTNGNSRPGFLDVETAIATNGFTVPYFSTPDRTQLWELAPRPSLRCIQGEFLPLNLADPDEASKPNLIKDQVLQFRQMFYYTDGRPSAWGPISDAMILNTAACQSNAQGLPRCIKLTLDAGGPHVEKIRLAVRKCAGNYTADQNPDWYQFDIVDKYEKCLDSDTPFYTRAIRTDIGYDAVTNTFQYIFCGKNCIPIARKETDLNYNPIPLTAFAMAPLDDRLLLMNIKEGQNPQDCSVYDKIAFTTQEPVGNDCQQEMVTIKFAVIIHNIMRSVNEFQFTYEENDLNPDEQNRRFFGGLGPRHAVTAFDDPGPYEQYFGILGKKAGFIAYVEGTNFYGLTKQYRVYPDGTHEEHTPGNMDNQGIRRRISQALRDRDYYFMLKGEMKVPKGTRGFLRLSSHKSTESEFFQDTSTTVMGILRNRAQYNGEQYFIINSTTDMDTKEIFFDACNQDVDLTNTPFIVADLTGPYANVTPALSATAQAGYLHDEDGRPVEGAEIISFGTSDAEFTGRFTDHNGFYFGSALFGDNNILGYNTGLNLFAEGASCTKQKVADATIGSGGRPAITIVKNLLAIQIPDYKSKYYTSLQVKVVDVNGVPIPGIKIALQGRKAKETATNGIATIFVRNYMPRYGTAMNLRVIPMQNGVCFLTTGNCNSCMPIGQVFFAACFPNALQILFESFPAFNTILQLRGLQPGGVYPLALKFMNETGHESFAEGDFEVQIPTIQEKQKFSFSQVRWDITGPMNLAPWVKKMAILIGRIRNYEDFITWVVDKVEFVDSSGKLATNLSADKIRLSIVSLFNNANVYGYTTNVKYLFSAGDQVEFIANGDGKIFTAPAKDLTFIIEADSNNREETLDEPDDRFSNLLISYSKDLVDLKEGALIKLMKPSICQNDEFYYETCQLIDVINGEPAVSSGILSSWDSYFVRRSIIYNDRPNVFSFPFLHHSPSDFWGDHCINRGRVSVKNPLAKQIQYGRKAMLSGALLQNGNLNGLGTYSSDLVKMFGGEQRGDIIAAISSSERIIVVICEYDHFTAEAADDFVRVGADGTVRALSGDSVISDAQSKIYAKFGCQYDDVSCIQAGDGWIFWIDTRNKAAALFDYGKTEDISEGKLKSYLIQKLLYLTQKNTLAETPAGKMRMISGIDHVTGNVLLTFFSLDGYNAAAGETAFVHNRFKREVALNETIAINPIDKNFVTHYAFTPEFYCSLQNSITGNLFITFKDGRPYLHRELASTVSYMEFFGVQTDMVLQPVINWQHNKVKRYLAMQQLTNHAFFCPLIETSTGQVSSLPAGRVKSFAEGKFSAAFLRDENSKGGLYNGNDLVGFWLKMLLVRDNTQDFVIGTTDAAKQAKYSELDTIIVKFMLSEQSAYGAHNQ